MLPSVSVNKLANGVKFNIPLPKQVMYLADIFYFAGAQLRAVGGCVRDPLLGLEATDFDLITTLPPKQVIRLLKSHQIKTIPTGIDHGTITACIDSQNFEITTLRKDISTDGRHAKVEFTEDFAIDAARRDFTINALSYCPLSKKIYDYCGGIDDIKNHTVKFIGNAEERIKEDYLRILRFFRFSTHYTKELDESAIKACAIYSDNLQNISKERIKNELDKLIIHDNSAKILYIMYEHNILQQCLPSPINIHFLQQLINVEEETQLPRTLLLSYAFLLSNHDMKTLSDTLKLHKFSNKEINAIRNFINAIILLKTTKNSASIRQLWFEKPEMLTQYLLIAISLKITTPEKADVISQELGIITPTFPISANELIIMGITGKHLGKMLQVLKQIWIESNFTHSHKYLLSYAEKNHTSSNNSPDTL